MDVEALNDLQRQTEERYAEREFHRLLDSSGGWPAVYRKYPKLRDRNWSAMASAEKIQLLQNTIQGDVPASPVVALQGQRQPVIVFGRELLPLSPVQYDVVKALAEGGETGLSGSGLRNASGKGDAVKCLKTVSKRPGWDGAITMAGKA